jgi:hypothetical protein
MWTLCFWVENFSILACHNLQRISCSWAYDTINNCQSVCPVSWEEGKKYVEWRHLLTSVLLNNMWNLSHGSLWESKLVSQIGLFLGVGHCGAKNSKHLIPDRLFTVLSNPPAGCKHFLPLLRWSPKEGNLWENKSRLSLPIQYRAGWIKNYIRWGLTASLTSGVMNELKFVKDVPHQWLRCFLVLRMWSNRALWFFFFLFIPLHRQVA